MGLSAADVCDPRRISREESIRSARRNAEDRSAYDIEIFHYLSQQLTAARVDVEIVERALEVLRAVAPPARLHAAIRVALSHEDSRVRSKAAMAVGQAVADLPMLQRLLSDGDPRVRANALEALWNSKSADVEAIFLRSLKDLHHRAVANAAYGLYLIDAEKHFDKVTAMVEHPNPLHRAAGAWLLRRIGNPKHLPLLKPLLLDKIPEVRSAGFTTLKVLRSLDGRAGSAPETKSETAGLTPAQATQGTG